MGKYTPVIVISLVVLSGLGVLAYQNLELYERPRYIPASWEAQSNEYLALDRWLRGAGYPVRVENQGSPDLFTRTAEAVVFIQASLFYWSGEAWEKLEPWVQAGGTLILSVDIPWYDRDEELDKFLETLGITDDDDPEHEGLYPGETEPGFDGGTAFLVPALEEDRPGDPALAETTVIRDHKGAVRLIRVQRGAGTVSVLGETPFLKSRRLGREPNARLAWDLLVPGEGAARSGREGILFIRGQQEPSQSFFGRLADRGNLTPLLVSALVLIAAGFWTVIPLFGVLAREDEKPGRPIRERFLAEGRFLQKYRALDSFRAAYIREIYRRLRQKENLDNDAALDRRFSELWARASPGEAASPKAGDPLGRRNFVKTVEKLQTILERL